MANHKDKKNLFKKLSFILEEQLLVEQIYNVNPQNIEILLHYSILDGLQSLASKSDYPNSSFQDSKHTSHPQQQHLINTRMSSQPGTSSSTQIQQSLMSSTTDIHDTFSGYSKNNVLSHLKNIMNIEDFYNKKGKQQFTIHSNYIF